MATERRLRLGGRGDATRRRGRRFLAVVALSRVNHTESHVKPEWSANMPGKKPRRLREVSDADDIALMELKRREREKKCGQRGLITAASVGIYDSVRLLDGG
jgi:hypothetical protein